jgi:glutamate-1-semialdehyde 2,1-aminomutase
VYSIDDIEVEHGIDEEQARFLADHPKSAAAWEKGQQVYLYGGPSHWFRRWAGGFPLYVDSASGAHITDIDGHEYVDFALGDTGGMCGHGNEHVTGAALKQLERGTTMMMPTEESLEVGALLQARFGLPYWNLTTSATDANRAAIRMARMITNRPKVLVFNNCYHGGVEEAFATLQPDGSLGMRRAVHHNFIDREDLTRVVEFNDVAALETALAQGDVACVLAEPVMTNYGMIPVADGYHEALRRLTRKHDVVLIIDETHTLSSGPGGYTAEHGLEPDVFVVGKAIAGGIPCGVLGVTEEFARKMWAIVPRQNPRHHQSSHMGMGGTLAGNALTIATMHAVLSQVLTAENFAHMTGLAKTLATGVEQVIQAEALPWHVSQIGARAEYMFGPSAPLNGAEAGKMRHGGLETLLHAWFLNKNVILTPFHNMVLMCPATSLADVTRHNEVFGEFVRDMKQRKILKEQN